MKLEAFFEKFDQLVDAPNTVAKMRELVLQLAVQGKLVEQSPSEGDAGTLLQAIGEARERKGHGRSVEDGETGELPEIERWHAVPSSWRWVRLRIVGDIVGGGTPRSDNPAYFADDGIPWLTPADLNGFKEKRILRGRRCITELGLKNSSAQLLPAGTVLFSSRAPIGYVAIAGTDLATNQGFKSCIPFIEETNEFLYYFLKSAAPRIDREASGTTFREVSGKIVGQIPVPLPPLAEQKRIVAKVDELMMLCDRLEAQQQDRDTRHVTLARASLARFAEAPTTTNLNLIFHPSYTIPPADLRKTILTLAVQGKLVPQDPNDEPAETLNSKLPHQLRTIADRVGARFSMPSALVEACDDLPAGWGVAAIQSIGITQTGTTPSKAESGFTGRDIPFIKPGDIQGDEIDYENEGLSADGLSAGRLIPKNSVLMVSIGGSIGKTAIVGRDVSCNQQINSVSPAQCIEPRFVLAAMRSHDFQSEVMNRAAQGTLPIISKGKWETIRIPIPPLVEQRRIVAKVDQLMALVGQLETQLAASRATAEKLMEAVVAELTAQD